MTYYNIHSHKPSHHADEVSIVNIIVTENGERRTENGFFSAGIHPWYIEHPDEQMRLLKEMAARPAIVAIGEAGLDTLSKVSLDVQQDIFIRQARLAEEISKPLIIHCVKAWTELMGVRKQIKPTMPWIIHGFRGNAQLAGQLIRHGFYLSFGIHFHPEALKIAWPDHLFIETDDAAVDIRTVYQRIAAGLDIEEESLARQAEGNVRWVFKGLSGKPDNPHCSKYQ